MIQCSISPRYENYIILFSLISVYAAFEIIGGRAGRGLIAAYIIASLFALYTYYYFIYILVFQNLYFLYRRRQFKIWLAAQALIAVCFIPWIPIMLGLSPSRNAAAGSIPQALGSIFTNAYFLNIIDIIVYFTAGMHYPIHSHDPASRIVLISGAVLPCAAFAGAFTARRTEGRSWRAAFYLASLLAICLFIALFGNIWIALVIHPKHAVVFSTALFLLLGVGIASIRSRPVGIALLALAVAASAISLRLYYRQMVSPNEFRETMRFIEERERPGDAILVSPAYYTSTVKYYYRGRLDIGGMPRDHDLLVNDFGQRGGAPAALARVREFAGRDRIWFVLPRGHTESRIASREAAAELKNMGFRTTLKHNFISDVIPHYDGFVILLTKQKANPAAPLK